MHPEPYLLELWKQAVYHYIVSRNYVLRLLGKIFDAHVNRYSHGGIVCDVPKDATTLEFRGRLLLGLYERPELKLVRRYIERGATVLELGGCLGVVACAINRRLTDGRRHVVLEAHPALSELLRQNRERNGCLFEVHHAAISRQEKIDFFIRDPFIAGGSTVRMGNRKIEAPTTSIAALEDSAKLRFDTLFIDIEGGEQAFFEENGDILPRMRTIIIEFHPNIIGRDACNRIRQRFGAAGLSRREVIEGAEAWSRTA